MPSFASWALVFDKRINRISPQLFTAIHHNFNDNGQNLL